MDKSDTRKLHVLCEAFEYLEKKIQTGDIHSTDAAADQSSTTTARTVFFSTATVTAHMDKEEKRTHQDMEDDHLDDSRGGGSTSHIALSVLAARVDDACPPVEIATRRSPELLSRKKKRYDKQNADHEHSLAPNSPLGAHGNEGNLHHTSSVAKVPRQKKKTFEERLAELAAFKAKYGHYNVPSPNSRSSEYKSLRMWINNIRSSYKKMQEGKTSRGLLSQDQIRRLEALGFSLNRNTNSTFEKWLVQLAAFKAKYGNCKAPKTPSSQYYSLGHWCSEMRSNYKMIQEGKTPHRPLSQDQIRKLEALGFEWRKKTIKTFEERLAELAAFKAKHGNCNVSRTSSTMKYYSLGDWCSEMRKSYKKTRLHALNSCRIRLGDLKHLITRKYLYHHVGALTSN